MNADEVKDVMRRARNLSHEIVRLTEDLFDLLYVDDDEIYDKDVIGEVRAAHEAAESVYDAVNRWSVQLIPDETTPAPAPASP
jgi:hypothetical protein